MIIRLILFLFFILLLCPVQAAENVGDVESADPALSRVSQQEDRPSDNDTTSIRTTVLETEINQLKIIHLQRDTELQEKILQLTRSKEVLETVIRNLIQRIEAIEAAQEEGQSPTRVVAAQQTEGQVSLDPELQARIEKESEENYQLIQTAFEQRLEKTGGMLLAPYQLVYEPSISYAHSSYDRVAIDGFTIFPVLVIGDIVSEQVRRDIITNNHTFRIGLPWEVQFDLMVPFGYENEDTYQEDGSDEAKTTSGLGDISLALSHQLARSHSFWPNTVLGISWKSASGKDPYRLTRADELSLGTGFETLGASITSMTTSDPVVLFGGFSATYTPGKNKEIGTVRPGESCGVNLGMAMALNFDTSLSFNYQYSHTLDTEIDNQKISGSDLTTSTFSIGLSKAISTLYTCDIDLGIGLTRDSPDFQLTVSFPIRFSLAGAK